MKNVLVGKGVGLRWVEGTDQAISRSKEFRALFLVSAKTTASKFAGCQISWGFRVGVEGGLAGGLPWNRGLVTAFGFWILADVWRFKSRLPVPSRDSFEQP